MYRMGFTKHADKEFKALPKETKESVRKVLNGIFIENPHSSELQVKKLHDPLTGFRLRIGNYRVLYLIEGDYIKVYKIEHRKDAYR